MADEQGDSSGIIVVVSHHDSTGISLFGKKNRTVREADPGKLPSNRQPVLLVQPAKYKSMLARESPMNENDQQEIAVTSNAWNLTALSGWMSVCLGLIGMAALLVIGPSLAGFAFSAFGLVGGAVVVSLAGPLNHKRVRLIRVRRR
ncbi:hypothetical protein QN366_18305 [Pseudomonas sp. CCC3.2]|nr:MULTISPECIES: hypothetical protein [unclassified Pseudomonas]MEA9996891.1 hypothetical protein [Pseudomonas sp. AA4]MDY7560808.1 hypothetical protein [Pseudomonas sp. AB6]MEB0088847.1 hypothetical protein [Pseudomonas sp. RTI1]MEB0128063.1 hypothetical protein [Pseudomonas sp. CCC1.2]MEB0182001.1 hypothetical protein [Pseudomonas sp. CCC3.2]